MAIDVLDILRARKVSPLEDYFDRINMMYPMYCYLSPQDIDALRNIATSVKLAGKIKQKYKMIDDIMRSRGFVRFAAGTNRVVYRYLEDTTFLAKIAVDRVGMQDNPLEYKNQFLLKPYVAKMFCISPCGTVGFSERVLPIKNKEEFKEIASDVFDILVTKILGKYVVEDVGTKYFMNWGIRLGYSPVLLDYPYIYKLDGKKLYCHEFLPDIGQYCNGEIDYNSGFNHLVCDKCGKIYMAVDLRDDTPENRKIIAKGGYNMRVQIQRGDKVIYDPIPEYDSIVKDQPPKQFKNVRLDPYIVRPNGEHYRVGALAVEDTATEISDVDQTDTLDLLDNEEDKTVVVQDQIDSEVDNVDVSEITPAQDIPEDNSTSIEENDDEEVEDGCPRNQEQVEQPAPDTTEKDAEEAQDNEGASGNASSSENEQHEEDLQGNDPGPSENVDGGCEEVPAGPVVRYNASGRLVDEKGRFVSTNGGSKRSKKKTSGNTVIIPNT